MKVFIDAISSVTGPLTLIAFLAAIILAMFRRAVNDRNGLKYIYDLFNNKLSKDQFYTIAKDIINRIFWVVITIFILSVLAFLVSKLMDTTSKASSQEYAPKQSANELVNILNLRAKRILETMETQKQEALASIRSGKGYDSETELLGEYEDIRKLFIDLHEKNVEAINNGQFVLSHEITSDIHHLLWIRKRNTFWGAYADRDVMYSLMFDSPDTYAKLYPGPRPEYIGNNYSKQIRAIWDKQILSEEELDSSRLHRIEEQLKEAK